MNKAAVKHQQDWLEMTICIVHNKSVIIGTEITYPSAEPEFIDGFKWGSCLRSVQCFVAHYL